ncbi:Tn554-related transposase A [Staphylococcus aureus]|nr:Transposase [Staphylococcus aureus]CXI28715.1 Tn554-related transposase A [Staphylococcus aureus]CXM17743.1 Tn554-related transposase A [Staphylococcus aureus]
MYTYTIKIRNEIIMKIVEVKSKNGINFMILDGNNEPIVNSGLKMLFYGGLKMSFFSGLRLSYI